MKKVMAMLAMAAPLLGAGFISAIAIAQTVDVTAADRNLVGAQLSNADLKGSGSSPRFESHRESNSENPSICGSGSIGRAIIL